MHNLLLQHISLRRHVERNIVSSCPGVCFRLGRAKLYAIIGNVRPDAMAQQVECRLDSACQLCLGSFANPRAERAMVLGHGGMFQPLD